MSHRRRGLATATVSVLALVATACGSSGGPVASPDDSAPPGVSSGGNRSDVADVAPGPFTGADTVAEVTFTAADGAVLSGLLYGPADPSGVGVVLAHMRGSSKEAWTPTAETLRDAGHAVLAYDSRGYGSSRGIADTALDVDQSAAIAYLRAAGIYDIVVVGASMNATAAVVTAGREDLLAVVALSPPATFSGLDAVASAPDVTEPLTVVVAADDEPYASASRAIVDAATASDTELAVADGSAHGTRLLDGDDTRATVLEAIGAATVG